MTGTAVAVFLGAACTILQPDLSEDAHQVRGPSEQPPPAVGLHRDGPFLPSGVRRIIGLAAESEASWIRVNLYWAPDADSVARMRNTLDSLSHLATEAGIEVVVTIRGSWRFIEGSLDPRYLAFLEQVAGTYGETIRWWQIENEVQVKHFWPRSTDDYQEVLEAAYHTIKSAEPDARILLAGLALDVAQASRSGAYGGGGSLVDRAELVAETAGHWDAIDLHLYHTLESVPERIAYFRSILDALHSDAQIWVTEIGGPDPRSTPDDVTVADVADEVPKRIFSAFAAGAARVAWHDMESPHAKHPVFGRFTLVVGGKPRPGWHAFVDTSYLLKDAISVTSVDVAAGIRLFRVVYGNRHLFAGWSEVGATCIPLGSIDPSLGAAAGPCMPVEPQFTIIEP